MPAPPDPAAILDPRIPAPRQPQWLAERRESLDDRRVLLFDNGKLAHGGPLGELLEILGSGLRARVPNLTLERRTEDLLQFDAPRIDTLVSDLAASRLDGVVLALCDWGVSQATALTAAGLERAGVPCSIVATEEGHRQVLATVGRLVPCLPVVRIDYDELSSTQSLTTQIRCSVDRITAGLVRSEPGPESDQSADARVPGWRTESGVLSLPAVGTSQAFTELMAQSHLGDGFPLLIWRSVCQVSSADWPLGAVGRGAGEAGCLGGEATGEVLDVGQSHMRGLATPWRGFRRWLTRV